MQTNLNVKEQISDCPGRGVTERNRGLGYNSHRQIFRVMDMLIILTVMVHMSNHQTVHFKYAWFIVCQ